MLRIYGWEKNQPTEFDKTDYQTLPIILYFTLFLFIYFMAAQKDCPDPVVGLGARLPGEGLWYHCHPLLFFYLTFNQLETRYINRYE